MALELFFVSARTNKRQHHYQAKKCACFTRCMKMCSKQKVRLLYASYELRVLCGVPWGSLRGTLGFSAGMNTILCGDRYRSLWGSLHSPPKRHLLPLPPSLPPLHQKKVHAVELIAPIASLTSKRVHAVESSLLRLFLQEQIKDIIIIHTRQHNYIHASITHTRQHNTHTPA